MPDKWGGDNEGGGSGGVFRVWGTSKWPGIAARSHVLLKKKEYIERGGGGLKKEKWCLKI